MKGVLTVFKFTFHDQVRKKSYIITTIIMVLLIVAALCIPSLVDSFSNSDESTDKTKTLGTFNLIDNTGLFTSADQLAPVLKDYDVKLVQATEQESIIKKIKDNSNIYLAVLDDSDGKMSFDYYVKSQGGGPDPTMLSTLFKNSYAAELLSENGVPNRVIANALSDVSYDVHAQGKNVFSGYLPAILVSLLLFMCIYMYGYWVAMSIASEKTSRVMELLITSTKPSRIVIGKSLAMGLLGLLQLLIVMLASTITNKLANPSSFSVAGMSLDFSSFTPFYAAMLIVYFILGFALYAMISAVAGATVSNADDVRTAIMPVSLVAIISFYFAYGTIALPDSTAATAASLVPFSAPFSMPSRILMASVPAWQIVLSFVFLALTTVLMAWISIRLYSSAVLHYGKKLKISELIAMSKKSAS